MSILDRVKNHISDNRGKYGAAAGAGLAYGVSQVPSVSPLINQAGFNLVAKGQNLALDAADKIGYGKEQLQNLGLENKIRPEDIQAGNEFYNSKVGQIINPNPLDLTNVAEHSSKLYNQVQEAKAQAQEVVNQTHENGQNYIDKGINFVKGLNPFNENTIPSTIKIPIKAILLENGNLGAWDRKKLAELQYLTDRDAAMSQNYQNNTGQYFLNPLVAGPINHFGTKVGKAYNGVIYDILKNKNAPTVNGPQVQVDATKGAWNSDMDSGYESRANYNNSIAEIRRNNPYQYLLNPFVPGMATEMVSNVSNFGNGLTRGLLSPFSIAGDTIRRG